MQQDEHPLARPGVDTTLRQCLDRNGGAVNVLGRKIAARGARDMDVYQ